MSRVRVVRDPTVPGQRPYGLPGPLPSNETLLWQGAPDWRGVARRVLHVRTLGIYFGVLVSVCAVRASIEQTATMWFSFFALVLLACVAVGLLCGFAMLIARTTVYTLTDRRLVLRIGVALTASLNLPFRQIEQASVRVYPDGSGEIALLMIGQTRMGYFMLWPHARPWRTQRVQPMLRCVPDASRVAQMLSRQLAISVERIAASEAVSPVLAATGD